MTARLTDIFGAVLDTNGQLGIGMSGAGEQGVADAYKIRIPANIEAILSDPRCAELPCLIRIAKWAHDAYLTVNAGDDIGALGQYLCWITGCVTLKGKVVGNDTAAYAGANLDTDNFYGEVIYDRTNVATPYDDITPANAHTFRPTLVNQSSRVLTIIVAAKITWWTTQHHLGSELNQATADRTHFGFLERVVRVLNVQGLRFDTPADRAIVYNLVHPWSTPAVFKRILKCPGIIHSLMLPRHPIQDAQDQTWSDQIPIPTRPLVAIQPDVELRKKAFGAGYAKLADLVAGLVIAASHPLFPFLPQTDAINEILEKHAEVKADVYKYGISARYLTGSNHPKVWDASRYSALIAGVATWLEVFNDSHSLRRSALFNTTAANMPGYSDTFAASCMAYKLESVRGAALDRNAVQRLMNAAGGLAAGNVDQNMVDRLAGLGASIRLDRLEAYIAAADDADSD